MSTDSPKTYSIKNYGCQMNVYDGERMAEMFAAQGMTPAEDKADADLVVLDPKAKKTISAKSQQSAIDYNVFEGHEVTGLPRFTLTRGRVAVTEGKLDGREGWGEFVARAPKGAVNRALSEWKALSAPRPVERAGIPATGV